MYELDNKHLQILKELSGIDKDVSHEQLREKIGFNKKTFGKKISDLERNGFIKSKNRDTWKRGQKRYVGITERGKKRVDAEDILENVKSHIDNVWKDVLEESVRSLENKPLSGQVVFYISEGVYAITHYPSQGQRGKLGCLNHSKENQHELGQLINGLIEAYVSEKGKVYTEFLPQKGSVFTMSFLQKEATESMKKARESGLISQYNQIMAQLMTISEDMWSSFSNKLQDRDFLEGKTGIRFSRILGYNPKDKSLKLIPEPGTEN